MTITAADASRAILLLEDMSIVRGGMKALIQIADPTAHIDEAASYDEAVALLEARRYDLAFLDYDLKSERTGLDVLRFMRERELETLAVMVSGDDNRDVVRACIDAGACGYIPKDVDARALDSAGMEDVFRRAIETVFRGCLYLPASVFGRGGHSPASPMRPQAVSAESLGLSPRQVEALYHVCQGLPNKAIANKMGIAENTVRKDYVTAIFRALGVSRRTELVIEVSRRGIRLPKPPSLRLEGVAAPAH